MKIKVQQYLNYIRNLPIDKVKDHTKSIINFILFIIILNLVYPISKDYINKNQCVSIASKQLKKQLPQSFINESELSKKELSYMLAYQLCTHRNDNS